jgi:hypothetical protein
LASDNGRTFSFEEVVCGLQSILSTQATLCLQG